MVRRLEYSVSDEVRQLAELYLKNQITKKQFDEKVAKTPQIQQIVNKLRREDKQIDVFCISKVTNLEGEHFVLYVNVCP